MRRRLNAAATAMAAALMTVAGCSGAPGTGASADPGSMTIELWGRGGTSGGDAWKAFLPQLEADTGVTVKFQQLQNFDQELQSRAQSKNLPDMWVNDDVLMGTYSNQGFLAEVKQGDYADAKAIDQKLWDQTKGTDGKYYAIPFSRQTLITLIRTDWLKKVGMSEPKTLAELEAVLDAFATKDPDGNGQNDTYGMSVPGTAKSGYMARWAMTYVWDNGGSFWKVNNGKYTATATDAATVASVKWIQKQFCTPGRVQPGAVTADTSAATPFFGDGKAGVWLTGPYAYAGFDTTPGKDKWAPIATPAGPGGNKVLAEGENIYISAGTKNTAAVRKVVDWLTSAKGQQAAMTNKVQPVVRVPVNGTLDAGTIYNDKRWAVVQDALKNSSDVFPATADVASLKGDIAASLNKVATNCSADPGPELENLQKTLTDSFKKQGVS